MQLKILEIFNASILDASWLRTFKTLGPKYFDNWTQSGFGNAWGRASDVTSCHSTTHLQWTTVIVYYRSLLIRMRSKKLLKYDWFCNKSISVENKADCFSLQTSLSRTCEFHGASIADFLSASFIRVGWDIFPSASTETIKVKSFPDTAR